MGGASPPRPLPNATSRSSMATEPVTVLQYNGPLLCSFNVPMKGLSDFHFTNNMAAVNTTNKQTNKQTNKIIIIIIIIIIIAYTNVR